MRQTLILTALCLVLLPGELLADVTVEPRFGHPYIIGDRIIFTSVDGKRVIGIDKQGRLQWEMKFPGRVYLQRSGDQLLVQSGRDVFRVNIADGTKPRLFRMPEHEILMAGFGSDFLAAVDDRIDHKYLRVISLEGLSTAWKSDSIESIVQVTASTVIAITADRKYEGRKREAYHLENGNLRSFDRKNGRIRWSMPLANAGAGSIEAVQVQSFVAVIDRLNVYDPKIGDTQPSHFAGRYRRGTV
jgi:hypothetical protein